MTAQADLVEAIRSVPLEQTLLALALLIIASVGASRLGEKMGVPALLLFLVIGMVAGSEGPGGIYFDDPWLAQAMGVTALALILFAGGLDTEWSFVRPCVRPAIALSTLGVLVTALAVGLFAWLALDLSPVEGLLLGSVISSTDAAAVFSVLRARRAALKGKLTPLLELESGTNDPMAVFLTVGFVKLLTRPEASPIGLIPFFILQMAVGGLAGYGLGRLSVVLLHRVKFGYEGLYPVLTLGIVLLTYGATAILGGSGFLAVYVAGMVIGNSEVPPKRNLMRFYDSVAWLMQILMFLTLGLLAFPSKVVAIAGRGLLLAGFLMLVARPVAVFTTLSFFRMSLPEKALVSWVGLRGAVPIVLATLPLLAGIERAQFIFNMVFFVVLTSTLLQGSSVPFVARWLGVAAEEERRRRHPLELVPVEENRTQLCEYSIPTNSPVIGLALEELGLPESTLVVLIHRNNAYLVPTGKTRIEPGDTLLVLGEKERLALVRQRFGNDPG
ncbi:MAG TPA: potassium/proton antiporter [Firmicutes bacterium]|nr:potassium/proton antiporter [Bacillota bacterium]